MSIHRIAVLALASGLALAGLVGWLLVGGVGDEPTPVLQAALAVPQPLRWPAREGGVWEFEVTSRLSLVGDRDDLVDAGVLHRMRGRLHARLARRSPEADLVAARLTDVDVSAGEVVDHRVARALEVPCVLRYARDGRLLGVDVASELAGTDVATRIHGLMAPLQCVVPAVSDARDGSWQAEESGPAGTWQSDYLPSDDGAIERVARRQLESARPGQRLEVLETRARFVPGGVWLDLAETHDRLRILERGEVFGGVDQSVRLRRLVGVAPAVDGLVSDLGDHLHRTDARSVEAATAADDRPATRAATAADRARFKELVAALTDSEGREVQALRALRALLREVPELAAAMPSAVRTAAGDRARAVLVHALESADVPSCHEALATIASDPDQTDLDRLRAVAGLGAATEPGEAIVDSVWEWASRPELHGADRRFADTALLAFGRLCERGEGAASERMLGRLEDAARHPIDDSRAAVALRAVGNAARPRLFEADE